MVNKKFYKGFCKTLSAALALAGALLSPVALAQQGGGLSFDQAIGIAIESDPWLDGSRHTEAALADEALAAAQLPDPKFSVTAANFPTDTFDFGQEAMTQLAVGVSQLFPRGDTRALARRQKELLASGEPLMREDRRARVAATVAGLWLDTFAARESIRLIEDDRSLFEELVDAAVAGYRSAHGRARQSDVIRAQLELTRLDDRLTTLRQRQESTQRRLSEWVGDAAAAPPSGPLPALEPAAPLDGTPPDWYGHLREHPAVQALDRRIDAVATGVDLARQKYKPEWALKGAYGLRGTDPMGNDRPDLATVGVSFDLPLFTGKRQDRELSAAVERTAASETERSLLLRQMLAQLQSARTDLERLDERLALYRRQLLPQMREQAEAALAAYNNDDGDFAEAVRARIAELNAKIDALDIETERLKTIARLNYLLARVPAEREDMSK